MGDLREKGDCKETDSHNQKVTPMISGTQANVNPLSEFHYCKPVLDNVKLVNIKRMSPTVSHWVNWNFSIVGLPYKIWDYYKTADR